MGRRYYSPVLEFGDTEFLNEFDGCIYAKSGERYVIMLSAELCEYFKELLYYHFSYDGANDELCLIWDKSVGKGTVSKNILKGSKRFFNLLKYLYERQNG